MASPPVALSSASSATSHVRWKVSLLLLVLTLINFADRGVLGAVAPVLTEAFHLSQSQYGLIAAGFSIGYAPVCFFSGFIVNALGPRRTYKWFVSLWSLAIAAFAGAWGFVSLLMLRIAFGTSEATVFACGSQLIGKWLPGQERGRSSALMTVGIPLGAFIVVPLTVWLTHLFGWQVPFIFLGAMGFVWLLVAMPIITDIPQGNRRVSKSELEVIGTGSAGEHSVGSAGPVPWGRILRSKTLWLTGLAFMSSAYCLYFMMHYFPTYLVKQRHVEYTSLALLATVPWLAMAIGTLVSGVVSDKIYAWSGGNLRWARSYLGGGCLVLTGALIAVSIGMTSTTEIVILLSIASGINFVVQPIFFAIPIDATPEFAGAAEGMTVGIGALGGVFAPMVTGFLVDYTGNFVVAFSVVAALPILFGLLVVFWVHPDRL
jgi:MFS family permease